MSSIAPAEKLLACVHCGLCLSSCPTYVETGNEADSPRGRIHLMRALEEGRARPTADVVRHLDLCLGCRACETACPSGVEYGTLIEGARSVLERRVTRSAPDRWRRALLRRVLPRPDRLAAPRAVLALAARLGAARLARAAWLPLGVRRLAALLPEPQAAPPLPGVVEAEGERRGTAGFLAGCVTSVFFGPLNAATVRLLARAGYRVLVPRGQACCGALLAHLGDRRGAAALARRNVNAFLEAEVDWVVTNAAGCGAMLREYDRLLAEDERYSRGATTLAGRARDVTELLAEARLPAPALAMRLRVAVHDACHLAHAQRVREAPRALLRSIAGVEVVEIADSDMCCGSAGTYNLTEPEMAQRLGERKARTILDVAPDAVAAANPGCMLQIRAALRLAGSDLPVLHPVELLARACGLG